MACLLVPATEAIVVEVIRKHYKKIETNTDIAFPTSKKLEILRNLLFGGSFLLLFEHVWHGEIVPWFPFLTAMKDANDTMEMLHEMGTVGITMAIVTTLAWFILIKVVENISMKSNEVTKA